MIRFVICDNDEEFKRQIVSLINSIFKDASVINNSKNAYKDADFINNSKDAYKDADFINNSKDAYKDADFINNSKNTYKDVDFINNSKDSYTDTHNSDIHIGLVCNTIGDVKKYLLKEKANVFFINVTLEKDGDGFELSKYLAEVFPQAYIILMSLNIKYVFKAFRIKAFDFVLKPYTSYQLEELIIRVYEDFVSNYELKNDSMIFRNGRINHLVYKSDIEYIQKRKSKIRIKTIKNNFDTYDTINSINKRLAKNFYLIKCHRSFIVNIKHIDIVDLKKNEIKMHSGEICRIGKKFKHSFIKGYSDFYSLELENYKN